MPQGSGIPREGSKCCARGADSRDIPPDMLSDELRSAPGFRTIQAACPSAPSLALVLVEAAAG